MRCGRVCVPTLQPECQDVFSLLKQDVGLGLGLGLGLGVVFVCCVDTCLFACPQY